VDELAIYGAISGTAALAWNVISWRLSHMTRLEVTIEPTQMIFGGGLETLAIAVRNRSGHPVQALAAQYEFADPTKRAAIHVPTPHESQGIPGVIPARSMAMRWTAREDAEYQGLIGEPIYAVVTVAERKKPFRSKVTTIPADAWEGLPGKWLSSVPPS
jgi:hypothetical protein